ncbi:MAG: FHA domain-containing protein [Deltaproteobacteria bacterium]|nr:FHA domain-containing protein [Deltaproteobacteria bacterium]MBW1943139.1 FHA domain-containing protein [Deltaproteobacteria bacterium]MBW2206833.1 FHA domain-containing protein [Deltaproteobacteria bacterium]
MIKIYIMSGPSKGESFDIKGDTVHIGRSPQNHIQIKDRYISRRHLQITQTDSEYRIKDMNSKNSTFVDGVAVDPGVDTEVGEGLPIVIGMSLICLGKECSENVLEFLGSFEGPEKADQGETVHQAEDRPMTLEKNRELIQKVSDVFMESSDINEILEKILEYILEVLKRVDRTFILLFDKTGEVTHIATRARNEAEGRKINYSQSVVDQVRTDGKAFMITDTNGPDRPDFTMTLDLEKIKSVMCVPLLFRSQIRGVIYVDSLSRANGFRTEDLSLLTSLSSQSALSIQSALVFSSEGQEL